MLLWTLFLPPPDHPSAVGDCEKLVNDLREFLRTRHQPQVSIVEDVELRTRDQAVHDSRVDEWDQRVVIGVQNQCWLAEFAYAGNAGPTRGAQQLINVAEDG